MKEALPTRVLRAPIRRSRKIVNLVLHHIECRAAGSRADPLRYPPVFIIGAPRCGSTLLYQVMVEHFDLGYLSNFHCLFYGAPSFAERLFHPARWRMPSGFQSDHGKVSGRSAPSECGEFWYRFFRRRPQFVPLDEAGERSMRYLRGAVRALVDAAGKPVLFKNLPCALRLGPIISALPESLFIVVQRDWLETAHSILESRRKLFGNYEGWFSVEPPEVESLKKRPSHEQVVEQIRSVHALIDEARDKVDTIQFIDVDYEELCRDTYATLDKLAGFFESNGLDVARGSGAPRSFRVKSRVRIDEDLYRKTKHYLAANPPSRGGL
jgi:hypothetical protein